MNGLSDQQFGLLLAGIILFGIITLWVLVRVGFSQLSSKLDMLLSRTDALDHHIRYPHLPPPDPDAE